MSVFKHVKSWKYKIILNVFKVIGNDYHLKKKKLIDVRAQDKILWRSCEKNYEDQI